MQLDNFWGVSLWFEAAFSDQSGPGRSGGTIPAEIGSSHLNEVGRVSDDHHSWSQIPGIATHLAVTPKTLATAHFRPLNPPWLHT